MGGAGWGRVGPGGVGPGRVGVGGWVQSGCMGGESFRERRGGVRDPRLTHAQTRNGKVAFTPPCSLLPPAVAAVRLKDHSTGATVPLLAVGAALVAGGRRGLERRV